MAQQMKNQAITGRDVDFAQWYTDVCKKAELMDYSSVKGFIDYLPYGYAIWEQIQSYMTTTTASSALATLKSWDSSEPTDVTESYHSTGDGNVTLAISQKATSSTKASNGTTVFNNNLIVSNDATEGSNKTTAKFSWGSAKVAIPSLSGYTKK